MLGARGTIRNVRLGDTRLDLAPVHDLASFVARTFIVRMGVQVPMQRVVFHSVLYGYVLESFSGDTPRDVAMTVLVRLLFTHKRTPIFLNFSGTSTRASTRRPFSQIASSFSASRVSCAQMSMIWTGSCVS